MTRRVQSLLAAWLLLVVGDASASTQPESALELAQAARQQHQLPAIAVLVQSHGRVVEQVALGVRKIGSSVEVTNADVWHIGSCTKAMTATLIAHLVERGLLSFDSTMGTIFPELSRQMDNSLRDATLTEMLSHTAGIGDAQSLEALKTMTGTALDVVDQRRSVTRYILTHPPQTTPGTHFSYSNLGYVIAAAAAEARTHKSWEQLIREDVFVPLHMKSAGFGPPGTPGRLDEPYGHVVDGNGLKSVQPEDIDAVLPAVLAPAGGVHASLGDWARFVQDQVDGALGHGRLLKPETYRRIQTPVAPSQVYGLGWGIKRSADGTPLLLTHNGSTDPWYAEVRAYPKSNMFTLVATNRGDDEHGGAAIKEVGRALKDAYRPLD